MSYTGKIATPGKVESQPNKLFAYVLEKEVKVSMESLIKMQEGVVIEGRQAVMTDVKKVLEEER